MKYIKTYEDIKTSTLNELLCIYSDHNNFRIGEIYKVIKKPNVENIGNATAFYITLLDSDLNIVPIELYTSSKPEYQDELTNMFETLIFTRDKSMEDYKKRKKEEKYNL